MVNNKNQYQNNKGHKITSYININQYLKAICISYYLIQTILTIQTLIYQDLTKQHQNSLVLINELSNIIKTQKQINNKQFKCLTIIPLNPIKNKKQKLNKLNITTRYQNKNKQQIKNKIIIGSYQDYLYDNILDILHGTCAIHETNQFLYEYCHKQKVRQFDSLQTKIRMNKENFEDITLGFYDYQKAIHNSQNQLDSVYKQSINKFYLNYDQNGKIYFTQKDLKHLNNNQNPQKQNKQFVNKQHNKNTIPQKSVIYNLQNLHTVESVKHRQIQFNKQTKIIHVNYLLIRSKQILQNEQHTHQITCQYKTTNQSQLKKIYKTKALVVTPYDLIFLGDINKCDKLLTISYVSNKILLQNTKTLFPPQIKFKNQFIYGNLDQKCTNNWDWKRKQTNQLFPQFQNNLQQNSTLLICIYYNISGKSSFKQYPVTIDKIIAPGLIKLKQNLTKFVQKNIKNQPNSYYSVYNCKIISQTSIQTKFKTTYNKFLNKKLIKIKEQKNLQKRKKSGDEILCLCKFQNFVQQTLQINLQLGKKIFQENQQTSIFEYYHKPTVKTYTLKNNGIHQLCSQLTCYDFKNDQNIQKNQQKEQKEISQKQTDIKQQKKLFTQIIRLDSLNPTLKPQKDQQYIDITNKILIFDFTKNGIIKIITQDYNKQKFIYYLSRSFIIKVKKFINGSLQIINENSFYQNQTLSSINSFIYNNIYLHDNLIFRGTDKIIFPRINMNNQNILAISKLRGTIYIRKWNIQKFNKKNACMITNAKQKINSHFKIQNFPIYQNQLPINLNKEQILLKQQIQTQVKQKIDINQINFTKTQIKPLNKSVSVKYQYFHGQFCGAPINKNRRTNVEISCGQNWMKIQQVTEISPCIYQLKVSTRLLCSQNYKHVIQNLQNLKLKKTNNKKTLETTPILLKKQQLCYLKNSWDNVLFSYDIDQKELLFQGNLQDQ